MFEQLHIKKPFEVHLLCEPEETESLEQLIAETWPSVTFGESGQLSGLYEGAVTTVVLTDRYFRAVAKVAIHYFLTQFPEYSGRESIFSKIRNFILAEGHGVLRANAFVSKRQHPLLLEMMVQGARPDGWRAHILCAEIKPGACLAHVQMFLTEDWPAPTYTVRLATDSKILRTDAAGHSYLYYPDGIRGRYSGEALSLGTTRTNNIPPPTLPVVEVI